MINPLVDVRSEEVKRSEKGKDIISKPQLVLQLQSDVHLLLDADIIYKGLQMGGKSNTKRDGN